MIMAQEKLLWQNAMIVQKMKPMVVAQRIKNSDSSRNNNIIL